LTSSAGQVVVVVVVVLAISAEHREAPGLFPGFAFAG